MSTLHPVTQHYLSIDAHSPESLKSVDRPLHADYWERFIRSMELLKEIPQRTVYRLTLVKDKNMDEIAAYARLVTIGMPTMIEVKGVTFSGGANEISMTNVPFHEDVRAWCRQLCEHLGDNYELACEHVHSCCILIADKRMKDENGQWHTWIDYPRFQELYRRWQATGETFTAFDYSAPTPSWAVFGAKEEGFAPTETRVRTKGKNRDKQKKADGAVVEEVVDEAQGCCKGTSAEATSGCCKSDSAAEAAGGCCKTDDAAAGEAQQGGCCQQTATTGTAEEATDGCCGGKQTEGCCKAE